MESFASTLQCEVCGGRHRAAKWRTQPSGFVVLCVSCRCAAEAIRGWRRAHPAASMDQLADYLSRVIAEGAPDDLKQTSKTA